MGSQVSKTKREMKKIAREEKRKIDNDRKIREYESYGSEHWYNYVDEKIYLPNVSNRISSSRPLWKTVTNMGMYPYRYSVEDAFIFWASLPFLTLFFAVLLMLSFPLPIAMAIILHYPVFLWLTTLTLVLIAMFPVFSSHDEDFSDLQIQYLVLGKEEELLSLREITKSGCIRKNKTFYYSPTKKYEDVFNTIADAGVIIQ